MPKLLALIARARLVLLTEELRRLSVERKAVCDNDRTGTQSRAGLAS